MTENNTTQPTMVSLTLPLDVWVTASYAKPDIYEPEVERERVADALQRFQKELNRAMDGIETQTPQR